ncbi:MAG: universal stress protein [Polyangiaceae bacterium]
MNGKPYVVLVGLDFSEFADRALQQALELASQRDDSQLHVLCVIPGLSADVSSEGYSLSSDVGVQDGVSESLRARVKAAASAFSARSGARGVRAARVTAHVRTDSPALGIVRLATELAADLIVVGSHGRQSTPRESLGSVAEDTLRYAGCPVLVVPAPTREASSSTRSCFKSMAGLAHAHLVMGATR